MAGRRPRRRSGSSRCHSAKTPLGVIISLRYLASVVTVTWTICLHLPAFIAHLGMSLPAFILHFGIPLPALILLSLRLHLLQRICLGCAFFGPNHRFGYGIRPQFAKSFLRPTCPLHAGTHGHYGPKWGKNTDKIAFQSFTVSRARDPVLQSVYLAVIDHSDMWHSKAFHTVREKILIYKGVENLFCGVGTFCGACYMTSDSTQIFFSKPIFCRVFLA